MEDGPDDKSTGKEKSTAIENQDNSVQVNTVVPTNIRRFLYLGTESCVYRSHSDRPRGFACVDPLGYNYLRAWSLEIFSDEMVEEYLKGNKDVTALQSEESLLKEKEIRATPKSGWPSPCVVHLAKEILSSYSGACRPAAIFILAACSRAKGPARSEAYSVVKELECPEDILLFVKFSMDLTTKHRGWGSGIRRAVKSWYANRCGTLELAEQVTRIRQRHSWSHKDVLKQIHIKPKDAVQAMVVGYTLFNLEKAEELFKEVPENELLRAEATNVMNYLEAADKLRKLHIPKGYNVECSQVLQAMELIKTYKLSVEHCDDTMLIAPKIWETALEHMPFWQLLVYIPILRFNRITKSGCELTKIIVINLKKAFNALTQSIDKEGFPPVSPALVLITMQTYRRKHCEVVPSKLWFRTHALLREILDPKLQPKVTSEDNNPGQSNVEKKYPKLPRDLSKPNVKVLEWLGRILIVSIKSMKPTRKRFIFGVGNIQDKVKCVINPYVVSFEAAALVYMCLEAAEIDGAITAFGVPVEGKACRKLRHAGSSLSNCAREIMLGMSTGPIKVDGWLDWLCKEKCSADVIVLMADEVLADNESSTNLYSAFINYKKSLKLSKVKLMIVSLDSEKLPECVDFKDDALMVHGFDSNLPFIIQQFASGCF